MTSSRYDATNRLTLYMSGCIFLLVVSGCLTGFLLFATSPRDIGALGVTLWFLGLFGLSLVSLTLLAYHWRQSRYPEIEARLALLRRCLRTATLIALFVTVGLAMQSLRMLSPGDILLFLLTLGIIELYFRTKAS